MRKFIICLLMIFMVWVIVEKHVNIHTSNGLIISYLLRNEEKTERCWINNYRDGFFMVGDKVIIENKTLKYAPKRKLWGR